MGDAQWTEGPNPVWEAGWWLQGPSRGHACACSTHYIGVLLTSPASHTKRLLHAAANAQTEQAKQFDPEYGREGADDEWGDALGYMDALAGGLNLQIARTISVDNYNSLPLTSPTLSQSMLLEASIKEVRRPGGAGAGAGRGQGTGGVCVGSTPAWPAALVARGRAL